MNAIDAMIHSGKMVKFYENVHGVMRAKITHPDVVFRYIIGPDYTLPTKIVPMDFTEEKTLELLYEGEEKTKSTIEKLINDPVREFKQ
jgi:hypothetical protein